MNDITAVLNAHGEGILSGPSLQSFEEAVREATAQGLSVETLIVMDRPNAPTQLQFARAHSRGHRVISIDFGDLGQARNAGAREARGEFVAFLDADDLWGFNWLVAAHKFCEKTPQTLIAHPECCMLFGRAEQLWLLPDSTAPKFTPDYLRIGNVWNSACFAARSILLAYPYAQTDLDRGFGHEDWNWNCVTLAAGIAHRPVPGTMTFVRRRSGSLSDLAFKKDVIPWPSPITPY